MTVSSTSTPISTPPSLRDDAARGATPPPPLTVHAVLGNQMIVVVLRGEADLATRELLSAALRSIDVRTTRAVKLHLADLTFADTNAVAELAGFAADARRHGCQVVTFEPSNLVARVAGLLAVDAELGIA